MILRYGDLKLHRRVAPLFLDLILGDYVIKPLEIQSATGEIANDVGQRVLFGLMTIDFPVSKSHN